MSDLTKYREELAEVLRGHLPIFTYGGGGDDDLVTGCMGCDWTADVDNADLHRIHVADALLPVLARVVAEAKAEALREAADEAWGRSCEARPAPTWRGVTAWLRETQRRAEASGQEGER